MIDVILIDDEYGILEGLKRLINWEEQGARICGVYTNPFAACEAANKEHPDLIITDIEMPGLSGLELIAALKKSSPLTRFVILSAYDYFSYAQNAIRLQVFRYLLKPLSAADLLQLLSDLKESSVSDPAVPKITGPLPAEPSDDNSGAFSFESEAEQLIRRSQELIEENFANPEFKLSAIADSLFVNYSYLSHLFKTKTGKTMFSFLLDTRMNHAAQLLQNTDLPVGDIARRTGYALTKNFHEAFKKYYGESPKNYRHKR